MISGTQYFLKSVISKWGNSVFYKGKNLQTKEKIYCKQIDITSKEGYMEAFEEQKLLQGVDNKYLFNLRERISTDECVYFILSHDAGFTMENIIKELGSLTEE